MQRKDLFRFYICLALAVVGIFSIFSPQYAMFAVVILLGIILTLWGFVTMVRFFNKTPQSTRYFDDNPKKSNDGSIAHFLLSILLLIAGILLLVFCNSAKDVFIPVVIGFWALVMGVFATINVISFARNRRDYLLSIIAMAVSFITAIVLFALSSAGFTSPAGGVFLLIFGMVTAIEISKTRRKSMA